MTIYFLNLILIVIFGIGYSSLKKPGCTGNFQQTELVSTNKHIEISFYIIVVQLYFVFAFRSISVGGDLYYYVPYYRIIGSLPWRALFKINYEPGYLILNKVLNYVSTNVQFLLIIYGIIVIISVARFVYKYSKIPWLSFYLFVSMSFFTAFMNNIRSSIALSILLWSLDYVKERRPVKFIFFVILAFAFHKTAVVFIFIYFLYAIRSKRVYILTTTVVGCVVLFEGEKIINYLISHYYPIYATHVVSGKGYNLFVLLLTVIVFGYGFQRKKAQKDDNQRLLYNMMLISVMMQILAFYFDFFARIVTYFDIAMICLIPNVINTLKIRNVKGIAIVIVCMATAIYFWYYLSTDPGGVVPYKFMWQN